MEKSLRNSNHELLRLVAMYMIVLIHANMYLGNFCSGISFTIFNGLVNGICNTGVTCFVLISGYYGIKFSVSKLVKMECMMITYSVIELVLLCLFEPAQMQGAAFLEQLIKSLFPFFTRKYWFYSSYVVLFLVSGYVEKFIRSIEKKEFEVLLGMLLIIFSIFPTVGYFEVVPDNGKGLVQMLMIYMVGRYIRIYRDNLKISCTKLWIVLLLCWLVNGISHEIPIQIGGIYHHLCKDNSITNIVIAIILFYMFKNINFISGIINKMAVQVFAVFALNNTMVKVFITKAVTMMNIKDGISGFIALAVMAGVIMVVCIVIGSVRGFIFKGLDKAVINTIERLVKENSDSVKKS